MSTVREQLAEALEKSIPLLCEGCYLKWPYTSDRFEPVGDGNMVRGVGEGDGHRHPRGGIVCCDAIKQRAALDRARAEPEEK